MPMGKGSVKLYTLYFELLADGLTTVGVEFACEYSCDTRTDSGRMVFEYMLLST